MNWAEKIHVVWCRIRTAVVLRTKVAGCSIRVVGYEFVVSTNTVKSCNEDALSQFSAGQMMLYGVYRCYMV